MDVILLFLKKILSAQVMNPLINMIKEEERMRVKGQTLTLRFRLKISLILTITVIAEQLERHYLNCSFILAQLISSTSMRRYMYTLGIQLLLYVKVCTFVSFRNEWEQKPVLIPRNMPHYNDGWFSKKELDRILREVSTYSNFISIVYVRKYFDAEFILYLESH